MASLLQDVRIDHGGGHIVVPEQLLNSTDIGAALQQMGSKVMAVRISILPMKGPQSPFIIITIRFMGNTASSFAGYDGLPVIKL